MRNGTIPDSALEATIEGARGLDHVLPTDVENVERIRGRFAAERTTYDGAFGDLLWLLGAYERARGEAQCATAAMESLARTAEEERAELVRERDALAIDTMTARLAQTPEGTEALRDEVRAQLQTIQRLEGELNHARADAEAAEREVEAYRVALQPDPNEADAVGKILARLAGTPEEERFVRFHRDYRFAIAACDRANEVLPDMADALMAARAAMADFNAGLAMDEIPWLTKTLPGHVTRVLIEQYRHFFAGVNAPNYVTLGINADGKHMKIILCTVDGQGPHELRREAEQQRDAFERVLADHATHLVRRSDGKRLFRGIHSEDEIASTGGSWVFGRDVLAAEERAATARERFEANAKLVREMHRRAQVAEGRAERMASALEKLWTGLAKAMGLKRFRSIDWDRVVKEVAESAARSRALVAQRDALREQIDAENGLEARNGWLCEAAEILGVLSPERVFEVPTTVRRLLAERESLRAERDARPAITRDMAMAWLRAWHTPSDPVWIPFVEALRVHAPAEEGLFYIQHTPLYAGDYALWWRPNRNGYTHCIGDAGLYSKEEADRIVALRGQERAWARDAVVPGIQLAVNMDRVRRHADQNGEHVSVTSKKLLVAGGRGAKDARHDLGEAIDSIRRAIEMMDEDTAAHADEVAQ